MPRRLLYSIEDAFRAAGFTNLPEPIGIVRAIREGRLPWITQDAAGRWGFDQADLPKIANALGMKQHEPEPSAAPSPLDALSSKFSELIKQDRKHG